MACAFALGSRANPRRIAVVDCERANGFSGPDAVAQHRMLSGPFAANAVFEGCSTNSRCEAVCSRPMAKKTSASTPGIAVVTRLHPYGHPTFTESNDCFLGHPNRGPGPVRSFTRPWWTTRFEGQPSH